ncbi:MAG TPA: alpha/beta hydrolase-fold protein [Nitrososphaerales archaeon]|nr:alpha/beta hydrolase-fold protein [Nitrososphaerales archaeon]
MKGKIIVHKFESKILKTNPLKDPFVRDLIVYLPPGYKQSESSGYVCAYGLTGFGGTGRMMLNIDPFSETMEQRMNRLISNKSCGPMILVLVDCFTKFGGNQYINSSATGRYEDYIVDELVPFIDENYNVAARAVWGKSSGGYGAFVLGARNPKIFSALADHSGDAAFEYCYLPDFPKALESYREAGGPKKWLSGFWRKEQRHDSRDHPALNTFAMAAHYSPNKDSKELGVDLPFNLKTGELNQRVFRRWLAWDPTRFVKRYADNLRKLGLIYVDCGTRDEFNLQWGERILHEKLSRLRIKHHYEEFEDGHMNIQYRYDFSLPLIYKALSRK